MWIIFKLIISVGAFFFRLGGKFFARIGLSRGEVNGCSYFIKIKKTKHSIINTSIGIDFKCNAIFKITKEGHWDRLFKKLLIVEEVQTGDVEFDKKFYIASDAPAFKMAIKHDPKIREVIHELFGNSCQHIFCDGYTLWCTFPGDERDNFDLLQKCVAIKERFVEVKRICSSIRNDPFAIKVLIIEAIIYSASAYAWTGFAEWQFFREDVHLSPFLVMRFGLIAGTLITLVFIAAILVILQKSSRAHRVIIESAVVLGLSIPVAGIQIVSDLNTNFDKRQPLRVEAKVARLYEQEHRGRRGTRYHTYHLDIDPMSEQTEIELPRHIEISRNKYNQLLNTQTVTLTIGKGYLNYPWYKEIEAR